MSANSLVVALSGGVGGSKLAFGLSRCLPPERLVVVCNTADDFEHFGLPICPDLDTVMYTLAGVSNAEQGWGLAGESWNVLAAVKARGGADWFRLGDRDLATHLIRHERLRAGLDLSAVTAELRAALGVKVAIWPMSDDPVRTVVRVAAREGEREGEGKGEVELSFQHYFVRDQCRPSVTGFRFLGIEVARPQPRLISALDAGEVGAIILCPSNPYVSLDPIMSLAGLRTRITSGKVPVVGVSPIIGGQALKGPAAKMMKELGVPASASAVAKHYFDVLDGFVIDETDRAQAAAIEATGIRVRVAQTVMRSDADRQSLAADVLSFAESLREAA